MGLESAAAEQARRGGVIPTTILAARDGLFQERTDWLAVEAALEIRARGLNEEPVVVAVTMRTPGRDVDLAAGFLFTEGLIRSREDLSDPVARASLIEGETDASVIEVRLSRQFKQDWVARNFLATSSCGVCGKATLDRVSVGCRPVTSRLELKSSVLVSLPETLRRSQTAFDQSGGLHAAGLFDSAGSLILACEDIGRHNAVDKVIGRMLLESRLPLENHILLVSGRLSFEILQKAAMAGVSIVAAVSAPSSLAVQAAQRLGVTVVGFLRGASFNVYTYSERIDP